MPIFYFDPIVQCLASKVQVLKTVLLEGTFDQAALERILHPFPLSFLHLPLEDLFSRSSHRFRRHFLLLFFFSVQVDEICSRKSLVR